MQKVYRTVGLPSVRVTPCGSFGEKVIWCGAGFMVSGDGCLSLAIYSAEGLYWRAFDVKLGNRRQALAPLNILSILSAPSRCFLSEYWSINSNSWRYYYEAGNEWTLLGDLWKTIWLVDDSDVRGRSDSFYLWEAIARTSKGASEADQTRLLYSTFGGSDVRFECPRQIGRNVTIKPPLMYDPASPGEVNS